MPPLRISVITYNIWVTKRWTQRAPALRRFLEVFDPDILCLQELQPESQKLIDQTLHRHKRVQDDLPGWTTESNIYWRSALFSEIEHGAEPVDIADSAERRLFWVRLRIAGTPHSILVATAHLTHQRNVTERTTGLSPRLGETRRIITALQRINLAGEPLLFMGDLNDPVHPPHLLHEAGYVSCFAALGLQPPPTFKVYPTAGVKVGAPVMNQCIDWLVANRHTRAVAAGVPQFYLNDTAPSDHWPVQAVYQILPGTWT